MRIVIVSSNHALVDACRVIADQLSSGKYTLEQCEATKVPLGCDFYIWDSDSIPSLPSAMVSPDHSIKLVIAKKSSLASVRSKLPHNEFSFLQSPVTPLSSRVVLESVFARLRQHEGDCSSRISFDRDQILQEFFETNLKLQEYDQNRTNFLTRAVHDLRVPIMAVQGYNSLLLAGQFGPLNAEQSKILERMLRSLTRLSRLADALLDLGSGKRRPQLG